MQKYEKEIKILDINVEEVEKQLEKIGAKLNFKSMQKIYVYDLPTIYYRMLEIIELLKSNNDLLINTNKKKLKLVFDELVDLITKDDLDELKTKYKINNLYDLIDMENSKLIKILSDKFFLEKIKGFQINPNKYIRLRQTNGKNELTVKHIIMNDNSNIQKVIETEINVSSFEETNELLESIGIIRRSYQEKYRYNYSYEDADIAIDEWPYLKPYMEIECDDNELMNKLIKLLNLRNKEIVSLNTEELYRRINIDTQKISELKFPNDRNKKEQN